MKIIEVIQNDLNDCGCACLSSIIKYYNGYIPIEKIRLDTYTDNGGTSAYNLIESSKKYGFDAVGKRTNITNLRDEIMPLIAHVSYPNGLNHYVVVYQIIKDKIILMDPAKGKVKMKINEFLDIWTNIVIIFHPKNNIIKYDNNENIFKIFFQSLTNQKNKFIYFVLINTLITILTIFGGFYFSFSIKNIFMNSFNKLIIVFLIILLIRLLLEYIKGKMQNIINYLLDSQIIGNFINHIFNLPLKFMQTRTSGEVIERVNELNNLKYFFSEIIITAFWDSMLAIGSLIIIMTISFRITIISIIGSILYLIIEKMNSKYTYKNIRELMEKDSEYNELLIENIKMYESLNNINGQDYIINKLDVKLNDLLNSSLLYNNKQNIINVLKNTVYEISLFISITFGLIYLANNNIILNQLILLENFLNIYWQYFQNILNLLPKYYYLKASFNKISEFYGIKCLDEEEGLCDLKNGDIKFYDLSINYNGKKKVISNFNCEIKSNSSTLVQGKTGTGKSSLLKCLVKSNEYSGDITISNINIKDYTKKEITKSILYVGQGENLFTGSIYDNICFGRNISIKKLYEICNICKLTETINKKQMRYNTTINNINNNISGGERQRIILARALLSNFKILILDEALSEVDLNTEKEIIKNIQNNFPKKTIIYVSHKNVDDCFKNKICLNAEEGGT